MNFINETFSREVSWIHFAEWFHSFLVVSMYAVIAFLLGQAYKRSIIMIKCTYVYKIGMHLQIIEPHEVMATNT